MDAIIKLLKDIDKIEDKITWFESMRPILEHNKQILEENSIKNTPYVFDRVLEIYNNG